MTERALEEQHINSSIPSELAEFIETVCQLTPEQAHKIVWSEEVELNNEQIDRLSFVFDLDRDLLASVVNSTSLEIISFSLSSIIENLDVEECHFCEELALQIEQFLLNPVDLEEARQIAVNVLIHTGINTEMALEELEMNEEFFDSEMQEDENENSSELKKILALLPDSIQKKVVAYAYYELNQLEDYRSARKFSAYNKLRDSLSSSNKQILDVLSKNKKMTLQELKQQLPKENIVLAQIKKDLDKTIVSIPNHDLIHGCLIVEDNTISMEQEVCQIWQQMTQIEIMQKNQAKYF